MAQISEQNHKNFLRNLLSNEISMLEMLYDWLLTDHLMGLVDL